MTADQALPLNNSTPGYVCRRLAARPDLCALHAQHPQRYPHLLASVAHGTPRSRYDILFAFPGDTLTLNPDLELSRNGLSLGRGDFLQALDSEWRAQRSRQTGADTPTNETALPFTGGWFIYLGYELVSQIEPTVTGLRFEAGFPVARATRIPAAIIIDHQNPGALLMCEPDLADNILPMLQADVENVQQSDNESIEVVDVEEETPARYIDQVRQAQEYIRAGDVFQVNLSRAWRVTLNSAVDASTLYRRLCAANPSPFAGLMTLDANRAVISSSPERLVEVRGKMLRTRPIAGTYPRSLDPQEDAALSRDLLRHPKERAEHVMLIDLERNDLGRICQTGSVRVNEFMAIESYRHVHHIVSEVVGELRDDISPAQVIRAVFPGGTITGCPKVRCMQIIAALEEAPRMAYTGSMGYINRDGSLDLNILIRTLIKNGNEISLRAGAGIVADSVPERELAETRAKARGMLTALGIA